MSLSFSAGSNVKLPEQSSLPDLTFSLASLTWWITSVLGHRHGHYDILKAWRRNTVLHLIPLLSFFPSSFCFSVSPVRRHHFLAVTHSQPGLRVQRRAGPLLRAHCGEECHSIEPLFFSPPPPSPFLFHAAASFVRRLRKSIVWADTLRKEASWEPLSARRCSP